MVITKEEQIEVAKVNLTLNIGESNPKQKTSKLKEEG